MNGLNKQFAGVRGELDGVHGALQAAADGIMRITQQLDLLNSTGSSATWRRGSRQWRVVLSRWKTKRLDGPPCNIAEMSLLISDMWTPLQSALGL